MLPIKIIINYINILIKIVKWEISYSNKGYINKQLEDYLKSKCHLVMR